jgi:hypothetical protein
VEISQNSLAEGSQKEWHRTFIIFSFLHILSERKLRWERLTMEGKEARKNEGKMKLSEKEI